MKTFSIPSGAFTALVTPFAPEGQVDWKRLDMLIEFQISSGMSGVVPVGTTGESPTVNEKEHNSINRRALSFKDRIFVLPGCGSNCTKEAREVYVRHAVAAGASAVLLVDCYYNGPSSLELREEYYKPIARKYSDIGIVPYIIPARTGGTGLFPEDFALLTREFPNIFAVKEATGNLERMKLTRALALPSTQIFSGDDDKTFEMMVMSDIKACGVISVISNIAPAALQNMCKALLRNDIDTAEHIRIDLQPLFKVVTVLADRFVTIPGTNVTRTVEDKFRNPLAIKIMMVALGMIDTLGRQPLGKMSIEGVQKVRDALTTVWTHSPEILCPIEEFFKVNISERLANNELWASFHY